MIHRVLFDTFEQAEGFYQGVYYCSDYMAWPPVRSRHGYYQVIVDMEWEEGVVVKDLRGER